MGPAALGQVESTQPGVSDSEWTWPPGVEAGNPSHHNTVNITIRPTATRGLTIPIMPIKAQVSGANQRILRSASLLLLVSALARGEPGPAHITTQGCRRPPLSSWIGSGTIVRFRSQRCQQNHYLSDTGGMFSSSVVPFTRINVLSGLTPEEDQFLAPRNLIGEEVDQPLGFGRGPAFWAGYGDPGTGVGLRGVEMAVTLRDGPSCGEIHHHLPSGD